MGLEILLVDNDGRWCELAKGVLSASGHRVRVAADAEAARSRLAERAPEAVLVSLDPPTDALSAVEDWQGRHPGALVMVASTRAAVDPSVKEAQARLGGARYLRRPVSMLDLGDIVARHRPNPGAAAVNNRMEGEIKRPPSGIRNSLDALTALVAEGAGERERGARPPLMRANESILPRGGRGFDRGAVDQLLLMWQKRTSGEVRSMVAGMGARLLRFSDGGLVDPHDLDLLRRLLAEGGLLLHETPFTGAAGDRGAVGNLLLEALSDPLEAAFAVRQKDRKLRVAMPRDLQMLRLTGPVRRVLAASPGILGSLLLMERLDPTEVGVQMGALLRMGVVGLDEPAGAVRPEPAPEPISQTTASSGIGAGFGRRATRSALMGSPAALEERLKREWTQLSDAPPASVLGVPRNSEMELVSQVSRRMRERYEKMAQDGQLSAEGREFAKKLAERVADAERRFSAMRDESETALSSNERVVQRARACLLRGDYTTADRLLAAVQEGSLGEVAVLAPLGWARFNNPQRPGSVRAQEGLEFLQLAEQFDGKDPDTLRWLAKALERQGELAAALARCQRFLKHHKDPEVAQMANDLERKLAERSKG